MDLRGPGRSTRAIVLFFIIIFPLGIVAEVVNRPNWNEADWKRELEIFLRKYPPVGIEADAGGPIPIPELIDCALDLPKKSKTCSDKFRTALLNEVLLRKKFNGHKEDCDSFGTEESKLVLNAPRGRRGRLDFPQYFIWQEKLINSKVELCDPNKFLRCSAERNCVCLSGTVRVGDVCVYSHGAPCTIYTGFAFRFLTTGQLYFDPFDRLGTDAEEFTFTGTITPGESSKLEEQIAPGCQEEKDECVEFGYIPTYYREETYCVFRINDVSSGFIALRNYFARLSPLPLNAKCSFQEHNHNRLFTSTKEEDDNFEVRFKTIEELRIRRVMFCDLQSFLTCGSSEKCECMSPSSEKDGKCVLPDQMDKCDVDLTMEPILMNKTLVPRARADLMKGFVNIMSVKACEKPLKCFADIMEIYCTCPERTTGVKCEDKLTGFLFAVRVPSLPTDGRGYAEKIKIFGDFNKKVLKFEEIFGSGEGDVCVWKFQNEAEILVGRIQKLNYRGVIMTKSDYEELSNALQLLQNSTITHSPFSRSVCFRDLRCQYSTNKCVRLTRRDYLQDMVKELQKSKTLKCEESGCSQFPRLDDFMFVGDGNDYLFYGGEDGMEYYEAIQRHSDLLNSNAKFCADGGTCLGRTPGTCDCQVPVVDQKKEMNNTEMNKTKMTLSFAHCSHFPNHLALLSSVAMIFVLSNC